MNINCNKALDVFSANEIKASNVSKFKIIDIPQIPIAESSLGKRSLCCMSSSDNNKTRNTKKTVLFDLEHNLIVHIPTRQEELNDLVEFSKKITSKKALEGILYLTEEEREAAIQEALNNS